MVWKRKICKNCWYYVLTKRRIFDRNIGNCLSPKTEISWTYATCTCNGWQAKRFVPTPTEQAEAIILEQEDAIY